MLTFCQAKHLFYLLENHVFLFCLETRHVFAFLTLQQFLSKGFLNLPFYNFICYEYLMHRDDLILVNISYE